MIRKLLYISLIATLFLLLPCYQSIVCLEFEFYFDKGSDKDHMLDDNSARQLDCADFNVEIMLSSKENVFH